MRDGNFPRDETLTFFTAFFFPGRFTLGNNCIESNRINFEEACLTTMDRDDVQDGELIGGREDCFGSRGLSSCRTSPPSEGVTDYNRTRRRLIKARRPHSATARSRSFFFLLPFPHLRASSVLHASIELDCKIMLSAVALHPPSRRT